MAHVAVTAIGTDRPGIVAAVSQVLVDHQCNLEDSSMTVLRGHFAMMLVVATPDDLDAATLDRDLARATEPLGLVVTVRAIDDDAPPSPPGDEWSVAVYGADRPGIVHAVAHALSELAVNIVDLSTRVLGDLDRPVYAMLLDVTVPSSVDAEHVRHAMERLGTELGVECTMHPSEADIL